MNTEVMFSSNSDEWSTPIDFFEMLNDEFSFTLDPCANESNHKTPRWYGIEDDGLSKDWGGERVFCNPPYSQIKYWVEKAYVESRKPNTIVVLLMPARTDTRYFHDFVYGKAELRFVKGRLKFGNSKNSAPFPSLVAVYQSDF